MNQRSLAISILQQARDALGERLAQRIVEARQEIADDAEGCSYLSEIETIYEQIGGRLAHLNAMLSNLPPADAGAPADATASEIIYADLASAYPGGLDLEDAAPVSVLALPAPTSVNDRPQGELVADDFATIVEQVQTGEVTGAARLMSELFDIKPSQARRGAQALAQQIVDCPDLVRRIAELASALAEANEYSAATLLSECFEFQPIEALAIVRTLKLRFAAH